LIRPGSTILSDLKILLKTPWPSVVLRVSVFIRISRFRFFAPSRSLGVVPLRSRQKEIRHLAVKETDETVSRQKVVWTGKLITIASGHDPGQFWYQEDTMTRRFWMRTMAAAALTAGAAAAVGAAGTTPATPQFYRQTNLVSDVAGLAPLTDPALVNPWGMSFSATSPIWLANAGSNTSTLYSVDPTTGATAKVALTVTVPGSPTGLVFNGTTGFVVAQGGNSGPSTYLFASQDGTITGWNSKAAATQAIVAATGATGSSYTGLTLGTRSGSAVLYAANNGLGQIDVYDQNFKPVTVPGGFADPNLPAGAKPYNISNINGNLYVTYMGASSAVNVFDVDGKLTKRLATGGTLHNPWGIALAPANFGPFSNAVLVGNFNFGNTASGPGVISAFDPTSGQFLGLLKDTEGNPIWIDGLWALAFGNGGKGGAPSVLYFTAGIEAQKHGLFGSIAVAP
jgi:uncharacterized protein (TIGR03118 family)